MIYFFLFIILNLNLAHGASKQLFNYPKSYNPTEECSLIDKLKKKCIDEFEKDKKLKCIGCGGGGREDNKHMHIFHFFYYEDKTPDQARELMVQLLERSAAIFNGCEKYQKYCKDAPYTAKNFRIYLSFFKPDGRRPVDGEFSDCCSIEGDLEYYKGINPTFNVVLKETFEEAKANLAENHNLTITPK